jgi:hypothetical protein
MSRAHEPFISSRLFRTYSNKLARLDGPCAMSAAGLRVGLAARNVDKLAALASEIGAETFAVPGFRARG